MEEVPELYNWSDETEQLWQVRVIIIVKIRFSVWLVSGNAHVFVLVSVVIVTLPHTRFLYIYKEGICTEFSSRCADNL